MQSRGAIAMRLENDDSATQPSEASWTGWELLTSAALCLVTVSILLAGRAGYMPTWWYREGHFEGMLVLLFAQLGIAAVQAFKFSADMTGSPRLMRAHDFMAEVVSVTLVIGGAIAVSFLGAFIMTMVAILFAAFLQIPNANPLRGDWAVYLLAGSILVVWLAAAVHRRARASGPDETFSFTKVVR